MLENHGMFSCREHWNGEHGVNMSFCTEVDHGLCMGVLLNGHLPWVFLALKTPLFFVGAFPAFLLSGISLELHLVAARPYKPYRTGCEISRPNAIDVTRGLRHHHLPYWQPQTNERSVGPDHFALVSFTLVVQIRLHFGSDGNRCRLTPSLVVLLQTAATHLDGIIKNNKLQTWQNTLGNFFSGNTLHVVWCAACIRRILGQVLCGSRIGNRLSVRNDFYVNEGVWTCRNVPPKFKFKYFYDINVRGEIYKWQIYVPVGILYCIQWNKNYFAGPLMFRLHIYKVVLIQQ